MSSPPQSPSHFAARLFASPLGPLRLKATTSGISSISFSGDIPRHTAPADAAAHLDHLTRELAQYFAGSLTRFAVPLDLQGTDFQKLVWSRLLEIPFGRTCSYSDVARAIGNPDAVRAVGLANGSNPVALVVPCHRVIGASGKLVGYGGELWRKQWLLQHESKQSPELNLFSVDRPAVRVLPSTASAPSHS
jgi:methylated-DNA-[protein]-cysteine S-methyltransferase